MKTTNGIRASLLLLSLLAGACSVNSPESAGPPPSDWKELASGAIRSSYFDPHSLRDAEIASPVAGTFNFQSGWVVCFRANARNRLGAYTGLRQVGFMIRGGSVVATAEQVHRCQGSDIAWRPFAMT